MLLGRSYSISSFLDLDCCRVQVRHNVGVYSLYIEGAKVRGIAPVTTLKACLRCALNNSHLKQLLENAHASMESPRLQYFLSLSCARHTVARVRYGCLCLSKRRARQRVPTFLSPKQILSRFFTWINRNILIYNTSIYIYIYAHSIYIYIYMRGTSPHTTHAANDHRRHGRLRTAYALVPDVVTWLHHNVPGKCGEATVIVCPSPGHEAEEGRVANDPDDEGDVDAALS